MLPCQCGIAPSNGTDAVGSSQLLIRTPFESGRYCIRKQRVIEYVSCSLPEEYTAFNSAMITLTRQPSALFNIEIVKESVENYSMTRSIYSNSKLSLSISHGVHIKRYGRRSVSVLFDRTSPSCGIANLLAQNLKRLYTSSRIL